MVVISEQSRDLLGYPEPFTLVNFGPVLRVEVAAPPESTLLQASRDPIAPPPPAVVGWALIDTGASRSCVDQEALKRLGLSPVASATVSTATGTADREIYPATFRFRAHKIEFEFSQVVSVELSSRVILGHPIVALIG